MNYHSVNKSVNPLLIAHSKVNKKVNKMETDTKKTITIKNALVINKEYLDNIQTLLGEKATVANAFNAIVMDSKILNLTKKTLEETIEENEKLKAENQKISEEKTAIEALVDTFFKENNSFKNSINNLTEENEKLQKENTDLKNRTPETIEVQLQGAQFICELDSEIAENARKVRKLAIIDGYVKGENYPNELVNAATKFFLNRVYLDKL